MLLKNEDLTYLLSTISPANRFLWNLYIELRKEIILSCEKLKEVYSLRLFLQLLFYHHFSKSRDRNPIA